MHKVNRALTVLYIENDPALRGLIANALRNHDSIFEVFEFESGEAAIAFAEHRRADVALLDISLGLGAIDGVATGSQLRRLNENIGIVLYSQLPQDIVDSLVTLEKREAWSYIPKRADMQIDHVVKILELTARGQSVDLSDDRLLGEQENQPKPSDLSPRQHIVLSLLATGVEPKYIAEKLEISFDSVRKDLSNAYSILVPNPKPGSDLRVTSILMYQRIMGSQFQHVE